MKVMNYSNDMNTRQEKIIEILKEKKDWIKGRELSALLNVSDRTIRNDIDLISRSYQGLVESSVRFGYRISHKIWDKSNIDAAKNIPQTSEERGRYVIKELLFHKSRLNIYDLQYDIYVSEFTIRNDLKKLEEMLHVYEGVELIRDGNYVCMSGNEEIKRYVFAEMLADEVEGNYININKIVQLFPHFNLIKVKDILERVLKEHQYRVREENFSMLVIYVGVTIQRMMTCNYIQTKKDSGGIEETEEYAIAREFFRKVGTYLGFVPNENDVVWFSELLTGRQRNAFENKERNLAKAEELMTKIVGMLRLQYDVDFSEDTVFKDGLVLHIQSLLKRIKNETVVSNVCLAEIKKTYPLVFEMSVFIGRMIAEYTEQEISEDEMGFLAIHIGAAYDRLNIRHFYHGVLIQPNSSTMSSICNEKIMAHFGDRLLIDAVFSYYEMSVIEELSPDLILSTIPLKHGLDIPIVPITMFVNRDDEYKIFKELNDLDSKRLANDFDEFVKCLIAEDYYFYNLECNTYEEAITAICDKMYQKGRVKESFKESILEREKMAHTSFSYGYALPHALNYSAIYSTMGIAVLKKPILWGKCQVKLVMLLAVRDDEKQLLRIFFDWFGNICDNSELLADIMRAKNAKEFIELIVNS